MKWLRHWIRLCLILTLFLVTPALSADWITVTSSADGVFQVDKASLKREGHVVHFWSRIRFSKVKALPEPLPSSGATYIESKDFSSIDCKNETLTVKSFHYYDEDGRVVYSSPTPLETQQIIPESTAASVMKFVCASAPKPKATPPQPKREKSKNGETLRI